MSDEKPRWLTLFGSDVTSAYIDLHLPKHAKHLSRSDILLL